MDEYAFSAATEGSKHVFTAHFLELKKKLMWWMEISLFAQKQPIESVCDLKYMITSS